MKRLFILALTVFSLILSMTNSAYSKNFCKNQPIIQIASSKRIGEPKLEPTFIKNVNAKAAVDILKENKNNPDFVILDLRTQAEYDSGFISGAKLVDFYQEDFDKNINQLDKNKIYLIYCRSGNRSSKALTIMKTLTFKRLYHLDGGIKSWTLSGNPLITR